jgi:hypothetical protein
MRQTLGERYWSRLETTQCDVYVSDAIVNDTDEDALVKIMAQLEAAKQLVRELKKFLKESQGS